MYVEGFVVAVPEGNRQAYEAHAREHSAALRRHGVARMVECWGTDVPHGKLTDFWRAVKAEPGEAVLFSWFEYPDRDARDKATAAMIADPSMPSGAEAMPFDASRMIYGGFEVVSKAGAGGRFAELDGMLAAVPQEDRAAYIDFAQRTAAIFLQAGASRVVDAWQDDVPEGKQTDFHRAVALKPGEAVVFGWVEWPSAGARAAGWEKAMADPAMQGMKMPFDGKRMVYGHFTPILDL